MKSLLIFCVMFLGYDALASDIENNQINDTHPLAAERVRVLQQQLADLLQRLQMEQQSLNTYHDTIDNLRRDVWHLVVGQEVAYPNFVEPEDTNFTVRMNARVDYAEGIARQMGFFPLTHPQPMTLEQIIERLNAVRNFPAQLIANMVHTEQELKFLISMLSDLIKPENIARFNLMDIRERQRYEGRNWGEAIRERLNIVVAAVQFIGAEARMEPFVLTEPLQEENMAIWAHRQIRAMVRYLYEPYEAWDSEQPSPQNSTRPTSPEPKSGFSGGLNFGSSAR